MVTKMIWGGSGIEKVVFDFIKNEIPKGAVVVELGAGHVSTKALCEIYTLYSVENQKDFIGHYDSNYIYAPIVNGWYDVDILKAQLPSKETQKLIFIDGINRIGILENLDLFNTDAMFLIHDTYREKEVELAVALGKLLKREPRFYTNGDYWAVI